MSVSALISTVLSFTVTVSAMCFTIRFGWLDSNPAVRAASESIILFQSFVLNLLFNKVCESAKMRFRNNETEDRRKEKRFRDKHRTPIKLETTHKGTDALVLGQVEDYSKNSLRIKLAASCAFQAGDVVFVPLDSTKLWASRFNSDFRQSTRKSLGRFVVVRFDSSCNFLAVKIAGAA